MENTKLTRVPSKFIYTPWQDIIAKSGNWFSVDTMKWWKTRVSWSSLTPIGAGNFLFITSDTDLLGGRVYSVREWSSYDGTIDSHAVMLGKRSHAVKRLKQLLAEEEKVSGIEQAKFGEWWNL